MAKVVARSNRVLSFVLTTLLFHMDVMLSVAVRAIAKHLLTSVLLLHSFVILDPRYTYRDVKNQHFQSTLHKRSTRCTLLIMLTILDDS